MLATILDQMIEGVAGFEANGRIALWNCAAETITGYRADEVIGSQCASRVFAHVDLEGRPLCVKECAFRAALRARETVEIKAYLRHRGGHHLPVRWRTIPLFGRGGVTTGGLLLFTEITASHPSIDRVRMLERMSYLDALTNIANRRYAETVIEARAHELERYGWPFGVVLLDVDNLKEINDIHGHEAGDLVLQMVARTLRVGSRPFDLKGRWGGDEFITVVANVDHDGLVQAGARLRALVEQAVVPYQQHELRTTVSIGAAQARPGELVSSLLRRADAAMYASKRGGKNQVSMASD
ncbi:MAG: diguanylate cyclase [Polyangiaceae bacterium]|nr:diguanylate cyclase [Polyangiaceae bacterium]